MSLDYFINNPQYDGWANEVLLKGKEYYNTIPLLQDKVSLIGNYICDYKEGLEQKDYDKMRISCNEILSLNYAIVGSLDASVLKYTGDDILQEIAPGTNIFIRTNQMLDKYYNKLMELIDTEKLKSMVERNFLMASFILCDTITHLENLQSGEEKSILHNNKT